jgi:hypothetical protein
MHRRDFGPWGVDLPDDEFARALAALGVLMASSSIPTDATSASISERLTPLGENAARLVRWSLSVDPRRLNEVGIPPNLAMALAAGWQHSPLSGRVRLEIDQFAPLLAGFDPPSTLPWIAHELSGTAVNARSVFVGMDEPAADSGWHWPLRIGFLSDPASRALEQRCRTLTREAAWISPLVVLVDVEDPGGECNLLVLPMDLRAALSAITALRTAPRADCVVVLRREQGGADQWFRLVVGLRGAARTSGVLVARLAARDEMDWVAGVVRELSHSNALDVAAFKASRDVKARPPFFGASSKLIEFSRLSHHIRRMGEQLSAPQFRDLAIDVVPNSSAARTLDVWPGSHPLGYVGERLKALSDQADAMGNPEAFIHETGAATGAAEIAVAAAAAVQAAPEAREALAVEPRFIQARVFDTGNPTSPVERRRSLRSARPHEVRVRIGLREGSWITGPGDRPFPVESLPPDQEEHELTVVLAEPNLLGEPQAAHVILPRIGSSTECTFHVFARAGIERLDARIIVAHRNRVLQTALLRGPIVASTDDEGEGIEVEPEVVLRASLDDLGDRQLFDAALVLNHDDAGISGITAVSHDAVARFTPSPTMRDEIDNLDVLLTQIVRDPKSFMGDLFSKSTTGLLRQFAQHGSLLYDHIVRDGGMVEAGLAGDGPLQVVSAVADARLPVEFVYAREAPAKGAQVCPNAIEALRQDKCDAKHCATGARERDFICPMAFWGVRRVIERHAHSQRFKALLGGDHYAIQSEPTMRRRTLEVLRGGLVAASQRVEKTVADGAKQVCDAITVGTTALLAPVTSWATWEDKIDTDMPSLLVLIVHTAASPGDPTIQQMEIGVESWLTVAELEQRHVRRTDASPPLVLLLGCETGVPDRQFANFINRLRNRGAAIVVAAGAKIHSLHAVPVAKGFVEALRAAVQREGATFGEVMRDVRREMLARGVAMVLTLSAYGDADWRLARQA